MTNDIDELLEGVVGVVDQDCGMQCGIHRLRNGSAISFSNLSPSEEHPFLTGHPSFFNKHDAAVH